MATRKKKSRVSRVRAKKPKKPMRPGAVRRPGQPDIAAVFQRLSAASGKIFTDQTDFLITEQSAHYFLTRTFSMLSNASRAGKLEQTAKAMLDGAEDYRVEMLPELNPLQFARANLPVFGEINGERLVKKIQGCINPSVPDALKTNY